MPKSVKNKAVCRNANGKDKTDLDVDLYVPIEVLSNACFAPDEEARLVLDLKSQSLKLFRSSDGNKFHLQPDGETAVFRSKRHFYAPVKLALGEYTLLAKAIGSGEIEIKIKA